MTDSAETNAASDPADRTDSAVCADRADADRSGIPDRSETPDRPVRLDDGEDLAAFVADHDLALVDLYTEGCTLCQAIEPVVGNVARATDAAVGMVNPRDDLDLVEAYDVQSVPTLLLFEDGELVGRMAEGFRGTEAVVEFVEGK